MQIRLFIILALALLAPASLSRAEDAALTDADRTAIRATVEQQLAAFQHDDWDKAFSFAAPAIQAQFINSQVFSDMVRTGYAPVYRPREVEFRDITTTSLGPVQQVMVVGPDGSPVLALYRMEKQPDGTWRIAGCILTAAPDKSA